LFAWGGYPRGEEPQRERLGQAGSLYDPLHTYADQAFAYLGDIRADKGLERLGREPIRQFPKY